MLKNDGVEVYKNDLGQIAVLISRGFGAGWSTWNDSKFAYDRRIVEFFLSHRGEKISDSRNESLYKNLFKSWGYEYVYFGGFESLSIEWVNPGELFRIDEYDGAESLVFLENENFMCLE